MKPTSTPENKTNLTKNINRHDGIMGSYAINSQRCWNFLPMKKQNLFLSLPLSLKKGPKKIDAYEFTDFPEKVEVTPENMDLLSLN